MSRMAKTVGSKLMLGILKYGFFNPKYYSVDAKKDFILDNDC